MALQDLLNLSGDKKKIGISEERVEAIKPVLRQYIAYWREYPDMFIDFLQTGADGQIPDNGLKFFFYQRVFLRAAMRYRYVYMVFPRAYSKSFLSVLVLMCRCILYPRSKLFVTSGGKEQAAGIVKEKVNELCTLVPALERELDLRPGKTRQSKDYCIFMFKNGSYFDNIAASEKSRGKRRHGGLVEECVGVDGTILNEVIIPRFWGLVMRITMEKSRELVIKRCLYNIMQANGKQSKIPCQALKFSRKVQRLSLMSVREQGGFYHHSKRATTILDKTNKFITFYSHI